MITAIYRGFSGGPGIISDLIKRLDRVEFNGVKLAPVIQHVYHRFEFNDRPSLITESHFNGGVQITPYSHLLAAIESGKVRYCYERRIDVQPDDAWQIWLNHERLHGDGYDLRLILSYWFWIRFGGRSDGDRFMICQRQHKWTCNEHYVATGAGLEPDIPKMDLRLTPEALFLLTFGVPSAIFAEQVGEKIILAEK